MTTRCSTDGQPVPLRPVEVGVDPEVLHAAEELLANVRAGDIVALVVVGVGPDDGVATAFSGAFKPAPVLGAMERVKARIMRAWLDDV